MDSIASNAAPRWLAPPTRQVAAPLPPTGPSEAVIAADGDRASLQARPASAPLSDALSRARAAESAGKAATSPGPVPYINQLSPEGKDSEYVHGASNCGPTSLAMVARAFGIGAGRSDAQLIMDMVHHLGTTTAGSSVSAFPAAAHKLGLQAAVKGPHADTAWVAAQLQSGKLVIADGNYYAMPPHQQAHKNLGHFIAVVGQTEDGSFLVHDPMDPAARKVSASELAAFINANPNNGGYQIAIGR